MNSFYLKNTPSNDLMEDIIPILNKQKVDSPNKKQLLNIIDYGKKRITTLNQITDIIKLFNTKPTNYKLIENYDYKNLFNFWVENLNQLDSINKDNIKHIIDKTNSTLNISGKKIFIPLRYGLINELHGPDLYTIISILGINESTQRLKNGI